MLKVIPPERFKTIPWKNGKGNTTELAISEDGSLDSFDWRLSIADVSEDGEFSDFSGYLRNLVLIEGNGIALQHFNKDSEVAIDKLSNLLDFATFNGGYRTIGKLHDGPIKDFNLMTDADKYTCQVETWNSLETRRYQSAKLNFIFSLTSELNVKVRETISGKSVEKTIPARHLIKAEAQEQASISVTGENIIFIALN